MQPISAREVVREAIRTYGRHTSTVLGTSAVLQLGALVITFVCLNAFGAVGYTGMLVIDVIAYQLLVATMTMLLVGVRVRGEAPTTSALLRTAAPQAGALLLLALIVGLGTIIGFIVLFIPGVVLSVWWALATPVLVVERLPVLKSLGRSRDLAKGVGGSIFLVALFAGVIQQGIPRIAMHLTDMPSLETYMILVAVVSTILGPLGALAFAQLYAARVGYGQFGDASLPAPTGPWIPGAPHPAASPSGGAFLGAPALPGSPMHAAVAAAPAGYGAPAPYGAPAAYGAPAPYGAPPAYGAPVYAAAPGQPAAPSPYGAPVGAPATHGAPTAPAAPAPYGAPIAAPAHPYPAAAPMAPSPYGMPPAAPIPPQPAIQHHAAHAAPQMPPQPGPTYPATGGPYGPPAPAAQPMTSPPMPAAAPMASPQAVPPAPPGMPPVGGPAGPVHPGRDQSVAPPGF